MRICLVGAVFPPEPEPAAVMSGELVRAWTQAGHDVVVVCPFPNRPGGVSYPGIRRRPWARSKQGGVTIVHVCSWLIGKRRRVVNRLLENLSFGLSSAVALLVMRRPDVVVMETWPVAAQLLGLCAARLRGIPLVNYIQDVYPEALTAAGILQPHSRAARLLKRLDRLVCARSARNVVVSEEVAGDLARSRELDPSRFSVISNWLDLETVGPSAGGDSWRREFGLGPDEFVCMFAGTMGYASNVGILVEVAEFLRPHEGIRIVCVGQGVAKPRMECEIAARGLRNLMLLPFQPRERVPDMQSAADVLLLTTSTGMGSSSVPSKLITYLAVGRPVVCSVAEGSAVGLLMRGQDLGKVVPPGDAEAFARAILEMQEMARADRESMGLRARTTALERYSLAAAVARFDRLLGQLGEPR